MRPRWSGPKALAHQEAVTGQVIGGVLLRLWAGHGSWISSRKNTLQQQMQIFLHPWHTPMQWLWQQHYGSLGLGPAPCRLLNYNCIYLHKDVHPRQRRPKGSIYYMTMPTTKNDFCFRKDPKYTTCSDLHIALATTPHARMAVENDREWALLDNFTTWSLQPEVEPWGENQLQVAAPIEWGAKLLFHNTISLPKERACKSCAAL